MSIPGSASPLFLSAAAAAAPAGYEIERSLRFNSADSAYLSRTMSSASSTYTLSMWVKRSAIGTSNRYLFSSGNAGLGIRFTSGAEDLYVYNGATATYSNVALRDLSAWYHIVFSVNSLSATIYVNNSAILTGASAAALSTTSNASSIGRYYSSGSGGAYFDGYLADVHFIDGQALAPTDFGETDSDNNWNPKTYSGTYGTNGFHLDFSDNSSNAALGDDSSGNNNDWTVNNISVVTGGPTSVASASGALPIFNTTDTYGSTKGSGLRADSNASALSLCVPMGTSTGLSLTDESPTGRTSSVSTLSNTSVTNSTSNFKFYGGSASFNGTSSKLTTSATSDFLFGTGDFTFEGWFYQTSQNTYNSVLEIGNHLITSGIIFIVSNLGNATIYAGGFVGSAPITLNKWNHIAYVRESGVLRIYVDGVLGSTNNFTGDLTSTAGGVTIGTTHSIGATGYYYPGFMQDLRIYKGLAKYTSNFNPPSSTQNTTIAAGNDSLVDSPTNGTQTDTGVGNEVVGNYCTLNPLITTSGPLSNGNLEMVGANAWRNTKGTISVSSGKWYFEATYSGSQFGSALGNLAAGVGFAKTSVDTPNVDVNTSSLYGSILAFNQTGHVNNFNAPSSARSQIANGDVIGLALDLDAGSYVIYVNNTSTSSGSLNFTGQLTPWVNAYYSGNYFICNFGQRAFAYTAPSGFNAINTASLSDPTIADGSTAMDVALYTGNGSTQTISGLGFSPDFVWIKNRQVARDHRLFDVVRGATQSLQSSLTAAEVTESTSLTAFTSDGFSLGSLTAVNESTKALVAWTWDAGSSTVSNTDGSITSSVRANASAGFSVVTYSYGNAPTVGHGLGAAPSLIIAKSRTVNVDWVVYHRSLGKDKLLVLNGTGAELSASNYWGTSEPSSTVFGTIGNNTNSNNQGDMVAYCFAPVEGYSAFGSYTGNGSADGPFVFTGFRPKFILVKRTDTTAPWVIQDSTRDFYNGYSVQLYPNNSNAEGGPYTPEVIDYLSNGFKLRSNTATASNGSGGTFIYAAFAEHPFKTARAR